MPTYKTAWEATHQASIDGLLGHGVRKVVAKGTGFYNVDNWTARKFSVKLTNLIESFGNELTRDNIEYALRMANYDDVGNPHLVVAAQREDEISTRSMRASVGGNYHEGFHYIYSCRREIGIDEVWGPLMERWPLLPEWKPYISAVLVWGNLIEDIRIERWGCRDYPGTKASMPDLQDLILEMEAEGRSVSEHRGTGAANGAETMSVIMGAFRDLGLGYDSLTQRRALEGYAERCPKAWALVTEGELKPLLDRAINMGRDDDLGHLWLAMEVVATLVRLGESKAPEEAPPPPDDGRGKGDVPQEFVPNVPDPDEEVKESEGSEGGSSIPIFKVGDRACLRDGTLVEVTWAGIPDSKTGHQELMFAPVIED